jgi:uncharacterized membrane protein
MPESKIASVRKRSFWQALLTGAKLRHRLAIAVGAAIVTLIVLPFSLRTGARAAIAWNVGGLIYLYHAFALMSACDTATIQRRARVEDEAKFVFFGLILLAIVSSFYAVFALIGDAKALQGVGKNWYIGLAAITVLVSWLMMQAVFTLHYAHDYYAAHASGSGSAQGLKFPGDSEPDYWDFFYFTTSIGATSQTSDVAITSKSVRRLVAFQAVLSFVFNTTIVALAINLASGLI